VPISRPRSGDGNALGECGDKLTSWEWLSAVWGSVAISWCAKIGDQCGCWEWQLVGVLRMAITWLDECARTVGVLGMATWRAMCGNKQALRVLRSVGVLGKGQTGSGHQSAGRV